MYMINDYQLLEGNGELFLTNYNKGIKINSIPLKQILARLKMQEKLEISQEALYALAKEFDVDEKQLEILLMNRLAVLKPKTIRKFERIYINSDNRLIAIFLEDMFGNEYQVEVVEPVFTSYLPKSLVLFFRKNYSHQDFKTVHKILPEDVYLITAGVVHKILVIDNLFYRHSGLPTHFSNFNNVLASVHNNLSITQNNWLLFYRSLLKENAEQFPEPQINLCQQGYIAYCLSRFISQFTNFWGAPVTLDAINWFWHVDLMGLNVFKEIAVHSPYSEFDMNLNLANYAVEEEFL